MNEEVCYTIVIFEVHYNENEKCHNSHFVLILNPDIIKDLPSYALADYSNEKAMELSHN